jgi:hypothetical protein
MGTTDVMLVHYDLVIKEALLWAAFVVISQALTYTVAWRLDSVWLVA